MTLEYKKTGIIPDGYTIVPPDGRWGWLVLIGCYICGGVICFPIVTFAVTMNDIKSTFNINTSTVSWTIASFSAVAGTLGPFAVVIAGTFSARKCTILGATIFCFTLIISSFATNIFQMILAYGLFGGLGGALLYVPLTSVLSGYFKEYYAIVCGIYVSSFSMAKVAIIPLAEYLNSEYGWRGCMLIIGGMALNACAAAALFQPPEWHSKLKAIEEKPINVGQLQKPKSIYNVENNYQTFIENDKQMLLNCHSKLKNSKISEEISHQWVVTNPQLTKLLPNVHENSKLDKSQTFSKKLKIAMDPKLLKMLNFYMFSLTYSVTVSISNCTTGYMFSHGLDVGLETNQAAWFASTVAIGEIFGRGCGPLIAKLIRLSPITAFIISLAFSAVVFSSLLFMTSHVMLFVTGGLLGVVFGGCLGLNFGIITELVGESKVLPTMGYSVLFQGIFILALGPSSGLLYDVTGSYGNCFMLYGGILALTFVAWVFYWKLKSQNYLK
ncbi:hypothetical protein CHUAL_000160 [Chamberlinius hualienensis]